MDPIFWLGLSILLVAVSIAAVLLAAIPALRELGRAAQGAEKLFDTLNRELPPTLEAIRLTSLEITELTDDITGGAQGASNIVQQVDGSVSGVKEQAQQAKVTTKSVMAGMKAAWKTLTAEEADFKSPPESTVSSSPSELVAPSSTESSSQSKSLPVSDRLPLQNNHHLTAESPIVAPPSSAPLSQTTEALQSRLAGYEAGYEKGKSGVPAYNPDEIRISRLAKPLESKLTPDE